MLMMVLMIMNCTKGRFLKIYLICFTADISAGTKSGLGISFTPKVVINNATIATKPKTAPIPLYAAFFDQPKFMKKPATTVVSAAPRMYPSTVKIMRMEISEVRSS